MLSLLYKISSSFNHHFFDPELLLQSANVDRGAPNSRHAIIVQFCFSHKELVVNNTIGFKCFPKLSPQGHDLVLSFGQQGGSPSKSSEKSQGSIVMNWRYCSSSSRQTTSTSESFKHRYWSRRGNVSPYWTSQRRWDCGQGASISRTASRSRSASRSRTITRSSCQRTRGASFRHSRRSRRITMPGTFSLSRNIGPVMLGPVMLGPVMLGPVMLGPVMLRRALIFRRGVIFRTLGALAHLV